MNATTEASTVEPEVVVVDTKQTPGWLDLHELWRYRDLIWILAARDITVRYRQTVVGIAWTVLQPVSLMFALGLFKRMVVTAPPAGNIPDNVKMLCGLVLYQLFAAMINASTMSLIDNRQMLTKVYFPRIVLPIATSIRPVIDFGIGLVLLILMMIWFQVVPSPAVILAPLVVLTTFLVGLGFGMWLSALNAHYRDFGHLVPFALQIGLLVSPIAIDTQSMTSNWRWIYFLNPMASLIEAFRWSVLGTPLPGIPELLLGIGVSLFIFLSGAWYFRRVDRFLADSI